VAVRRVVERLYPMGSWLWVETVGVRRVSDRTASYIRDSVDIRVGERHMECYRAKVWVI